VPAKGTNERDRNFAIACTYCREFSVKIDELGPSGFLPENFKPDDIAENISSPTIRLFQRSFRSSL